jgi:hypothetical protein
MNPSLLSCPLALSLSLYRSLIIYLAVLERANKERTAPANVHKRQHTHNCPRGGEWWTKRKQAENSENCQRLFLARVEGKNRNCRIQLRGAGRGGGEFNLI